MWRIFNGLKKKKENLIALKAQKNSTLAASENQTHNSLSSRSDALTTEPLELYGEKTQTHWYPFSDTFCMFLLCSKTWYNGHLIKMEFLQREFSVIQ